MEERMIYEFLYRGPIAAEKRPSAWHVIIAEEYTSFGETKLNTKGPMTPDQSAAAGFPLSDILAEINATALSERDAAVAATADEVAAHEATKAKAQEMAATLDKVAAVAADALDRAATHEAAVADLQARLDALKADAAAVEPADLAQPANPVLNKLTFGLLGK
jgi:hypothetical protein